MTTIALTSDYIMDRMNSLPPHSRKRPGYEDLLAELRKRELRHDAFDRECEQALEEALFSEDFQRTAGLVL